MPSEIKCLLTEKVMYPPAVRWSSMEGQHMALIFLSALRKLLDAATRASASQAVLPTDCSHLAMAKWHIASYCGWSSSRSRLESLATNRSCGHEHQNASYDARSETWHLLNCSLASATFGRRRNRLKIEQRSVHILILNFVIRNWLFEFVGNCTIFGEEISRGSRHPQWGTLRRSGWFHSSKRGYHVASSAWVSRNRFLFLRIIHVTLKIIFLSKTPLFILTADFVRGTRTTKNYFGLFRCDDHCFGLYKNCVCYFEDKQY